MRQCVEHKTTNLASVFDRFGHPSCQGTTSIGCLTMAETPGTDAQVVSQYPAPPKRYYASLTNPSASLPTPPEPPGPSDTYSMFGRTYSTADRMPSLQESGRVCLYDESAPVCDELQRLNRMLMKLFHALLMTLCTPNSSHENVIARIEDVFINMQHLLNTLRPAQAVKDLVTLLDRQTKTREETTKALRDAVTCAEKAIAEAATAVQPQKEESTSTKDGDVQQETLSLIDEFLKTGDYPPAAARSRLAASREWYCQNRASATPQEPSESPPDIANGVEPAEPVADCNEDKCNPEIFETSLLEELERIKKDL